MNNEKYSSHYLGIVIQNNDPEKRGRVKVFIPHLSSLLYDNWNEDIKKEIDKGFVFLDKKMNPELDKILKYLKESLPWAEVASPIFGGSATGRYNAFLGKGTTSDSNYWEGDNMVEGFRPLQLYTRDNRLSDAFTEASQSTINASTNPLASQYTPSDYSNLARGVFTIPNVGSHVWVFFNAGDINYPIVFAAAHGMEDWQRIYTGRKTPDPKGEEFVSADYPDSYENLSNEDKNEIDHNIKTFRSKHVINTNKHVIEMIDTDLSELLKFTSYSGSFLEFNNNATIRLATNNDQALILGDQFLTIRKDQSIYIAGYQENIIEGDRITKLGDFKRRRQTALKIQGILRDIHQYKRLFEVARTNATSPYTSPLQVKIGEHADCPICLGEGELFDSLCVTCGGTGKSPSTQDGKFIIDPLKLFLSSYIREKQKLLFKYEGEFGNGGDDIDLITGSKLTTIGTVMNSLESFRVDPVGKLRDEGIEIAKGGLYMSMAASPLVEYVDVDNVPGGDWDVVVGNKYSLCVGSKGIRIKTTGPVDISGTILNISGEATNIVGKHELLLESGKRVEMRGDIINLHPFKGTRTNVLIDGQLGVRSNVKVAGGAHVEGELSYLHSTTPYEIYMTDYGNGPIAHTHTFRAPPWTLLDCDCSVRDAQSILNNPSPARNSYVRELSVKIPS